MSSNTEIFGLSHMSHELTPFLYFFFPLSSELGIIAVIVVCGRVHVRVRRATLAVPSDSERRREEINGRVEGSDNGLSLSALRLRFAGAEAAAMTDMLMCLTESRDGWREGGEEGGKDADARRLPSSLPPATRPLRALADSRPVMKPGLTLFFFLFSSPP